MFAPPGSGGATGPAMWPTCTIPHCGAPACVDSNSGYPSHLCVHHFQEALQFQQQQYARHQFPPHHQQQPQQYFLRQQFFQPEQHRRYPHLGAFQPTPMPSVESRVTPFQSRARREELRMPTARRPNRRPSSPVDVSSVDGDSRSVDGGHRRPVTPSRPRSYSAPGHSNDSVNLELGSEVGQDTMKETDTMILFWKPPCTFSQWTPSTFYVDKVKYCSFGQYMAASKASLFDDENSLRTILDTEDPARHKYLGLQISNFDQVLWDRKKKQFALLGNYQKFTQNPHMCHKLAATGNKMLVAASVLDLVWSAGKDVFDPIAECKEEWTGENLLGEALMKIRQLILLEKPEFSQTFLDAVLSSRGFVEGSGQNVPAIVNGVIIWP